MMENEHKPVARLTKREQIAAMAMQAMIEAAAYKHSHSPEGIAIDAIEMADALLAELDRTGGDHD